MDKYDIDFFLSFQFLGDAQLFEEFYNDYAFIQGNQDQSSDCKNDTIDIIKTSIREYIL